MNQHACMVFSSFLIVSFIIMALGNFVTQTRGWVLDMGCVRHGYVQFFLKFFHIFEGSDLHTHVHHICVRHKYFKENEVSEQHSLEIMLILGFFFCLLIISLNNAISCQHYLDTVLCSGSEQVRGIGYHILLFYGLHFSCIPYSVLHIIL